MTVFKFCDPGKGLLLVLLFLSQIVNSQLYINEFAASSAAGKYGDPSAISGYYDLLFKDYPDWIEIYNASDNSIDMSHYWLTDDLSDLNKWQIPDGTIIQAKGYKLFIADGHDTLNHTNFSLSIDGESIALSNKAKKIIDSVIFTPQTENISMGRSINDVLNWGYYRKPTPGAANSTVCYKGQAMTPVFSIPAGFYDASILLELSSPDGSDTIRYTTDGSETSSSSTVYTGPITISKNTVIRAKTFASDKLASEIVTKTYFISENVSLPVASFAIKPSLEYHFPGESEYVVNFEYFSQEHKQVISQIVGTQRTGLINVFPLKTTSVYARKEYGNNRLNYRFFKDKTLSVFKNVVFRNAGYLDYSSTYFRDGLIHSFAVGNLDIEFQSYQPVVVFLNGKYHGLMNLRDKENEYFIANNGNVEPDEIDYLEYETKEPIQVLQGSAENYNAMMKFVSSADFSKNETIDKIKTMIDFNSFCDYFMLEIYAANADWPDKNVKIWRSRLPGGKWRWVLFDTEYGFGYRFPVEQNMFEYIYDTSIYFYHNREWSTRLFRNILSNESALNYFVQRFCARLNTSFNSSSASELITSLKEQIEPEIERHIEKWGLQNYGIGTLSDWYENCQVLYDFASLRPTYVRRNMMDYFKIADTVNIDFSGINGTIYLNDIKYCNDTTIEGIFFKSKELQLKAVPKNGYKFVKWINTTDAFSDSITYIPDSNAVVEAVFAPVYTNILEPEITMDTVLSDSINPYIATGDIIIPENTNLTLEAGVKILMPEKCNIYVYGTLTVNGHVDNPVVIDAFSNKWGAICIKNSTGITELNNLTLKNATTGNDPELYVGAISAYQSDLKIDGAVIKGATVNCIFVKYGTVSIKNSVFQSNGTGDLVNVKHVNSPIIENCQFMDSKTDDTDAIDFDDVSNARVRNNIIRNMTGPNNDGLDIGEESKNIQIDGNLIYNCFDKGISVGQASTVVATRNVIYNCGIGMASKDLNSYFLCINNTLCNNSIGVVCYEKNMGKGVGNGEVVNTIIADAYQAPVVENNGGNIDVSYSISNTSRIDGAGNLYDQPALIAPYLLNFEIQPTSPCINSGDPASPHDGDGTVADMGAYFIADTNKISSDIIVNEFYSHSDEKDPMDWIELYNKGNSEADLSGWYLVDKGISFFKFPDSTTIKSREYLVICKDTNDYRSFFVDSSKVLGNFDFSLGNSRDRIELFSDEYKPVKMVSYDEDWGWPDSDDKHRLSVALIDTSLEMTDGINWRTGYKRYGTPGYSNIPERISGLYINEIVGNNQNNFTDNYGEYEDWIEIYNANDKLLDLGSLYLTDDLTKLTLSEIKANEPETTSITSKGYKVLFADEDLDQGVLHLDFKISSSGEKLVLVQLVGLDTLILDQVAFGQFMPDSSYGRVTDGSDEWKNLEYSPGISNAIDTYHSIDYRITIYPNPVTGILNFEFLNHFGGDIEVKVIDILGETVGRKIFSNIQSNTSQQMDLSNLKKGLYILKISNLHGETSRSIIKL